MMRGWLLSALVALTAPGCGSDAVTASSAAAACVTVTACKIASLNVSQCTPYAVGTNNRGLAAVLHASPAIVNCLADAGSNCDNARKCLNGGMTPSACTGNSGSCTGTVLSACSAMAGVGGNKGTTSFDCGSLSQMCVVNGNAADCGYGSCAPGTATCIGSKVQSCNNGILKQNDCAQDGSTCVVGAFGDAHCRGTGAACQGSFTLDPFGVPLRCDGNTLVTCRDSQEAKFDCASSNLSCLSGVNGGTFGCALGNKCNATNFSHTCSGNKLSFCNDGVLATYDCGAAGYHGCDPNAGTCVP